MTNSGLTLILHPIPLTIYPSSQYSRPLLTTPFYNPFHLFLSILCLLSSYPILNHMYSHTYVSSILNLVLYVLTTNENFRKVFTTKTNLLCNPTTKVATWGQKNVTFLSKPLNRLLIFTTMSSITPSPYIYHFFMFTYTWVRAFSLTLSLS